MTAKKYLKQLERLNLVIKQKLEELKDLKEKSTSIGSIDYSRDRVQHTPSCEAPFVKIIEEKSDLEKKVENEIAEYKSQKHKIINQIQSLDNSSHIQILYKRYVELKDFDVIASEMGCLYQSAINLHGKALINFKKSNNID